jgi:methyl-accepting chemotaxis protein
VQISEASSNAIRAITRCMEDINAHTSEVADAITRQELATGEISHNVAAAAFGDVAGEFA